MHMPLIQAALFRKVERILASVSALVAGLVTMFVCQALSPDLDNPLALLGSAAIALTVFINVFGLAVMLFLLPWEYYGDRQERSKAHEHSLYSLLKDAKKVN